MLLWSRNGPCTSTGLLTYALAQAEHGGASCHTVHTVRSIARVAMVISAHAQKGMCARSNMHHFTRIGMEFVSRGISLYRQIN